MLKSNLNKVAYFRFVPVTEYQPKYDEKILRSLIDLICVGDKILLLMVVQERDGKFYPQFVNAIINEVSKDELSILCNLYWQEFNVSKKRIKLTENNELFISEWETNDDLEMKMYD